MIIGFEGQVGGSAETAASTYSLITTQSDSSSHNVWGAVEYKIVSTTQSGLTVAFGQASGSGTTYWIMLVDAVDPAPQVNGSGNAVSVAFVNQRTTSEVRTFGMAEYPIPIPVYLIVLFGYSSLLFTFLVNSSLGRRGGHQSS